MIRFACSLLFLLFGASAAAQTVQLAVAANFAAPIKQIAAAFEQSSGFKTEIVIGATGKFYAQIKNGAPFDILLSADRATATRLVQEQFAEADSQCTYAIGKLVLWSATRGVVDQQGAVLKSDGFHHLAIAAPQLAPYGAAAIEALTALHLKEKLTPRLVQGESIAQTYTFIATGNAELGFVALSQVWNNGRIENGSAWIVPQNLYTPIRQDAVLLKHGKDNPAALALLTYLKSEAAKKIIHTFGYD